MTGDKPRAANRSQHHASGPIPVAITRCPGPGPDQSEAAHRRHLSRSGQHGLPRGQAQRRRRPCRLILRGLRPLATADPQTALHALYRAGRARTPGSCAAAGNSRILSCFVTGSECPATPQDVRVAIAPWVPRPPQPCSSVAGGACTEGRFEQVEDGGVQAGVGPGFPVAPWVVGQVLAEHAEMQGG